MKETKNETIEVVYRGIVHVISMEEFEALRNGWISWADMFD